MKVKAQDSIVNQSQEQGNTYENNATTVSEDYFTGDFNLDLEVIKKEALDNSDVYCREFNIGGTSIRAVLVFVEGLSDKDLIDTHILKSLMGNFFDEYKDESSSAKESISKEYIRNQVLSISGIDEVQSIQKMMPKVLMGSTALLIDGLSDVLILNTKKEKHVMLKSQYQRDRLGVHG
ncbi:Uncharacterized membrane protein yndD [Bacillus cereus AH1272]|nr:Uncharacterized membrane protein yndD [Bacillus cereus AH1272]EEL93689.1 Uncharacterized membrane protein yndD [Bacillus cereus AH1273]